MNGDYFLSIFNIIDAHIEREEKKIKKIVIISNVFL